MDKYTILNKNELCDINGGVVAEAAIIALLGGAFTAGYKFGTDLANGDRRRRGK
ncbi:MULTISPECIES: class IIb bacteriocin, lactobin A/cerein 7B family [Streptococcus]|uniref:class IIb bacteriocin, lactobin A/cerein 7B family n=1 Tax=Streptococcus TaxID=1301 RepID=UPI0009F823F3|nr:MULTISPECIES: class IIb bacteriocin, lactobin A/cerein 7B family [Streptococcus]MBF0776662.1 class IIb bacteriocin, lactobin A/cerein 7B family [Streptococcus sp. 19428wD3_AN2]TFU82612.1 class IIb bacteriocin, lactobin A/cerein 7B family [Streptococcus sp. AN2]